MILDNSKDEVEIRKCYYDSGALWWESQYVEGRRHGTERGYYESGALSWETPYVNGEIHGLVKGYYESGALWFEIPYVNGEKHGIEKNYDKDRVDMEYVVLYKEDRKVATIKI